jgi:Arc/MetJ family transcription regulator
MDKLAVKPEPGLHMHQNGILIHMRTTMILNEDLIEEARRLTGLTEKTAIVHAGLEALIARESARRLAELGGTMPDATAGRRRRSAPRRKP